MFRLIEGVLDAAQLGELANIAASAPFVDGRVSNPHSRVKNNLQLHDPGPAERATAILAGGLLGNPDFFNFAFPKAIAPPILTRYEKGMSYGLHPDSAMMQLPSGSMRSDLSCTIFLTDPAEYEGGALRIVLGTSELRFRGPRGSAIVYPSTSLHEVEPVTRGVRLVGLTFIQSRIADTARRELLYELNEVAALEGNNIDPHSFARLQAVQYNLLRQWVDAPLSSRWLPAHLMERARPAPADAAAHEAAMIRSPAAHLRLSIRAPIVRQFRNSPPVLSAGKRLNAQKYHIVLVEL